ncbi:MAG: hypothetical protein OEX83_08845, partial [Gammaproteobacteria bacterium]|nr:hypothetical protein [Gammaproteobacteria bacterium]
LPNNSSALSGFAIDNVYISPVTSTGVQDSATISGSFSGSPSWSILIKNSANTTVKTFAGTSLPVSVSWTGDNESAVAQPDGIYSVNIINNSRLVGRKFVQVDNTMPIAVVNSPVAGNLGVGVKSTNINALGSDANFLSFTIEKADGFSPAEGAYVALSTVNDPVAQTAAYQHNWQFINPTTGVQEPLGDKTIRLKVSDKAGNTSIVTVPITIDYISITNVSHSTSAIEPVLNESVDFTFTLGKPATVTLKIYPELNTPAILPIRLAEGGPLPPMQGFEMGQTLMAEVQVIYATAGTYTINWDGRIAGPGSDFVPQDAYRYEIEAFDAEQSNVYSKPILQVDFTNNPDPASTTDLDLYTLIQNGEIDFSQNKYVKSTTTVSPGNIVRKFIHLSLESPPVNTVFDEGTYSFMFDGRDRDGRYVDESILIATNVYDYELALSSDAIFVKNSFPTLLGTEAAPNVEIKSDPYFVEHSYDQVSQVAFTVDEASYITVKLLEPCNTSEKDGAGVPTCTPDPSAASTITLIDNQLKPAYGGNPLNVITFEWRGYDFEAPAADTNNILVDKDGLYTYLITATSQLTGNTTTYRGALQLKQ